ncbi:MAG TPA: serine/threonine-protein kinase [Polyangia bacterium]
MTEGASDPAGPPQPAPPRSEAEDPGALEAAIAARVKAGDYGGAAETAAAAGQLERAVALYERVWRFADALPLAERLGRPALAVRLALDARLDQRARAIAAGVPDGASAELLAVSAEFAARGRWLDAAGLSERAGDHARAAVHYQKGGALLESAQSLVRAGDLTAAGRRYAELASAAAADGDVLMAGRAQLGYGALCGQLGRPREAARALQAAAQVPALTRPALTQLRMQLLALGLPRAAAIIEARLRELHEGQGATDTPAIAAEVAVGTSPLPRFSNLALIGAGSLGRVFRAHDRLLGETIVLKLLGVGGGAREGSERQAFRQFVREAEASSRLRHPNIVRVHDIDEASGLLVLEHLPGGTLADLLAKEGALPLARVRRLALDVLGALAEAHRAGIVHRDVKPANIFLDAAGGAKLGDFGASHLADFGGTQTAGFIGTLGYLSPEQISGGSIGAAADLYGLGATLFEALTGRLPFLGPDIAGQHLAEPPPHVRDLHPELPEACDDVIARALAKNPGDRFASADLMAEAVRAWPQETVGRQAPLRTKSPLEGTATGGATPAPSVAAVPLGKSAQGELSLRFDARLGQTVLVETLTEPLDARGRAELMARAALGGPTVQRVLRLEDDRTIVYEALGARVYEALGARPTSTPWDVRPLSSLAPEEQAALAGAAEKITLMSGVPVAQLPAVLLPTGPVILLVVTTSTAAYS